MTDRYTVHPLDCRVAMSVLMEADSVDSIVCDPPYGLSQEPNAAEVLRHWLAGDDYTHTGGGFMGRSWDSFVPGPSVWREAYRVLKPGGHLLAFFGTRTYDLGCMAIRLAGFEIRDEIAWIYGSGFPKSLDISKAIDRAAGAERTKCLGRSPRHGGGIVGNGTSYEVSPHVPMLYAPATIQAAQWQGWGTALKPAHEPIVVARKPLGGRTVAANVQTYGTGGLNIDGCRVGTESGTKGCDAGPSNGIYGEGLNGAFGKPIEGLGRFPANVMHDGSDEVLACFPTTSSTGHTPNARGKGGLSTTGHGGQTSIDERTHDTGSAARFFYCAKASKADRDEGVSHLPAQNNMRVNGPRENEAAKLATLRANHHPTVKPTNLMRYLCRLVTPPGGTVLDPFAGSGSTGKAAILEGFHPILCEMTEEYLPIIYARLDDAVRQRYGLQS
jgi:site-specific DNA-methyltransferase (adenine-specific)